MTSTLKTEKIQFRGDNSDAITLASSGKVGIGTTSPSETFHVKGFARIESNAGDAAYMRFVNDVNSGGKTWRAGAGVSAHGTFSIYNQTDNKFGINVNSDGSVNKPNQPMVFAIRDSSRMVALSGNAYATVEFTEQIDVGNDFASHEFTCPVDGKYFVSFFGMVLNSGASWAIVQIQLNGTGKFNAYEDISSGDGAGSNHISASGIISASKDDTIRARFAGGDTNSKLHEGNYGGISIQLIA